MSKSVRDQLVRAEELDKLAKQQEQLKKNLQNVMDQAVNDQGKVPEAARKDMVDVD